MTGQMSAVETRQMTAAAATSVLSQQQTSVLSQQKTSFLSPQKTKQQPAGGRQLSRLLLRQDRCLDWCGLIDCSGRVFNFFIDILRDTTHI